MALTSIEISIICFISKTKDTEMKIDKDIPAPEYEKRKSWPFVNMEVGDSVFFEGGSTDPRCHAYSAARAVANSHGKKFIGRNTDGGVRIWRIS